MTFRQPQRLSATSTVSADVTTLWTDAKGVFAQLEDMIENGAEIPQYQYIGLRQ